MFIWENDDGSVVYTGSFNQAEWDAYHAEHGAEEKSSAPTPKKSTAKKAASAPAKKDGDG